jgi:hypothetical protein
VEIRFTFEEPKSAGWGALECARLLCDLQHLCLFAMYLVDERVLDEYDVFAPRSQEYKFMIEADMEEAEPKRLQFYALRLWHFHYYSPPEIEASIGHFDDTAPQFKFILEALKEVIEQTRKKAEMETEYIRQRALRIELKNIEHVLEISKRFANDPEKQRQFITNMMWAIRPFTDGKHPPVTDITVRL